MFSGINYNYYATIRFGIALLRDEFLVLIFPQPCKVSGKKYHGIVAKQKHQQEDYGNSYLSYSTILLRYQ